MACLVFASVLAGLGPRSTGGDEAPAREAARFAGAWLIDSFEAEGLKNGGAGPEVRLPPEMGRLTIRGDRFEFVLQTLVIGLEETGTFSIVEAGPGQSRVDVDVVERSGGDLGKYPDRKFVRKELWRLTDSGQFQRCFPDDPSRKRPETFATKKGDGHLLMTFERRKE